MVLAFVIVAIVLLVLAAINWPQSPVGLGWLGLAFWAASTIIGKLSS